MSDKFYKHPTYGHVYGVQIKTPAMRVCWPHLIKPKEAPEPKEGQTKGEPRFEITQILTKDAPDVIEFCKTLKAMTDEMLKLFNKGRSALLGECLQFGKYGDGDTADHEVYPYYKNSHILIARNAKAVKIVDRNPKNGFDPKGIVGGVICHLVVTPLITAHGISYKLEVVQFVKDDGIRFGGGLRDATELLDACGDEESESAEVAAPPEEMRVEKETGMKAVLNLL